MEIKKFKRCKIYSYIDRNGIRFYKVFYLYNYLLDITSRRYRCDYSHRMFCQRFQILLHLSNRQETV
jgi:hypothetical protein